MRAAVVFAAILSVVTAVAPSASETQLEPAQVEWRNSTSLQKRIEGGVEICTDLNWGGQCGFAKQPWDLCIRLDSPWWHSITSIGPDQYNVIVAYEDYNCQSSNTLTIWNPGYSDLTSAGWNDRIGSFMVKQIAGPNCLWDYGSPQLPSINCRVCCNGCNRSGTGCCPAGMFC
ncbi:Uncharacterized protein PECH_000124 [Penicillium ucsense]|uniref:Uncharacterized protein n=1 Tax=Penicillium ucsense TaxID=2839758 RepID=A0A8J8W363_9EURO|nr:Uncharacterized protein PECM_005763 [Penicillium ucsense]KAF7739604.1 Uncharacterized protein PECH_000124 [Penicillium ucsense]